MKDFYRRFSAALGVAAFGVAGFASMYNGSLVTTSIIRASIAGALAFLAGTVIAYAIYDGPVTTPAEEFKNIGPAPEEGEHRPAGKGKGRR